MPCFDIQRKSQRVLMSFPSSWRSRLSEFLDSGSRVHCLLGRNDETRLRRPETTDSEEDHLIYGQSHASDR